jgi:hypothetical protein
MDKDNLILRLYQHYEDYAQGRTQSFYNVTNDCKEAACQLVKLSKLIENAESAQNAKAQLAARLIQLQAELTVAVEDIRELALNSEDTCQYCKYDKPCIGDICKCFIEGVGMTDNEGKYYNTKWTCMDFNYGECPMLENTPCNGCAQNDFKNFEWRGIG